MTLRWSDSSLRFAFILLGLTIVGAGVLQNRNIETIAYNENLVSHTNEVKAEIFALGSSLKDLQRGVRGYLLTTDAQSLQPYNAADAEISVRLKRLASLTADNSSQRERLARLTPQIQSLRELFQ